HRALSEHKTLSVSWSHYRFYIYVSSRVRMPSKVRAFIDFMVEKRVKIES
ncbi:hypothetical protein M4Z77_22900, partial [Escherichia coli]|nr:hypothetical protein [Escherichia coli]